MATPTRQKRSNDFTGRQAATLAAQAAAEQKLRTEELSMMAAAEQKEFEDAVFDSTANPQAPVIVDEVVEVGVVLADNSVVVRVAEDVDNMTYGYGNDYTFKAGGKYKVPKGVAERLEELGLLYERL